MNTHKNNREVTEGLGLGENDESKYMDKVPGLKDKQESGRN